MTAAIIDITRGAERRASQPGSEAADTAPDQRLYWRAIVRVGGQFAATREGDRVEWHLAGCAAPGGEGEHCNEGMHAIETIGHPAGHCLVHGVCARCTAAEQADALASTAPRELRAA